MRVESAAEAAKISGYREALTELLFQLADDELVMGHRDSEWLGLAPDIEEDVAFSSIAQDEVGHSVYYFERLHELGETDSDRLAFDRGADRRRNAVVLERPNGDWAYTIARHFFYDVFDQIRLEALSTSGYVPLAHGVTKIRREEHYHLLHMRLWFTRLGSAGGEATERMRRAVRDLWTEIGGLFSLGDAESRLLEFGIIPIGAAELKRRWEDQVRPAFEEAKLPWPGSPAVPEIDGRKGEHTSDLERLLDSMTEVFRLDPAAKW
ncbi:1,2-phenylacetyl-CoA epoxidase subunit PaaC [Planifilum fimeticola]